MNGIHAYREAPERPEPFHDAGPQRESTGYELGRGYSKKGDHADALILGFPVTRTMTNPVVFESPRCGMFKQQYKQTGMGAKLLKHSMSFY